MSYTRTPQGSPTQSAGKGQKFRIDPQTGAAMCVQHNGDTKRFQVNKEGAADKALGATLTTIQRGRYFHKCSVNASCGLFAWEEDVEKQRRAAGFTERLDGGNALAPPSPSPSRPIPSTPSSSRNAAANAALARAASSSPSKRKSREPSEDLWDKIEDIDDDELSTIASQSQTTPSKRQRFDSFGGGSAKLSTYDQIRNDPSSPFHATLQRVTAASSGSNNATPVAGPSSSQLPPQSSPSGGAAGALEALKLAEGAHETIRGALERFERLLKASTKRCDVLVDQAKKRDGEIESLQARVRLLETENAALKAAAE